MTAFEMADTYVTRLDEASGRRIYEALGHENFHFRTVPHAWWGAKGAETTITFYRSGKLVVQGPGTDVFVTRHLPGALRTNDVSRAASVSRPTCPEIGSDESGKGDYFGPLVVAAALVHPDDLDLLDELGVQDSKKASDTSVRRVEGMLERALPHAVRVLEPEAYNKAWGEVGNLNRLLGRLHAEVIEDVRASSPGSDARIVVDRFGDPEHVRRNLGPEARRHPFLMPIHGESHPAVAAASFLARAAFLRGFEKLNNLEGGALCRGASDPRIVEVARRLHKEGGEAWLGQFAKLHFKTTAKARAP